MLEPRRIPDELRDKDVKTASSELEAILSDVSKGHRLRAKAARELGRLGRETSAKALSEALKDDCPAVRHAAIIALGEIGGYEAASRLEELLESNSPYVRKIAATGLLKISKVPKSIPENMELLEKLMCSGDMRVFESLLDIGPVAVEFLKSRLIEGPFPSKQNAALALAVRIRKEIEEALPEEDLFACLNQKGISKREIAELYAFKATRHEGRAVKVENTGFELISETLRGDLRIVFSDQDLPEQALGPSKEGPHPAPAAQFEIEMLPTVGFDDLLDSHGAKFQKVMGRTIIAALGQRFLAIKLCAKEGDEAALMSEINALRRLGRMDLSSDLPEPLGQIFRIDGLPEEAREAIGKEKACAICYACSRDYRTYLNDPNLSSEELMRGFKACSRDLGTLARHGAVHAALIPLYHRRATFSHRAASWQDGMAMSLAVPEERRYAWWRKVAGRLDSWERSCRYPNLRLSGIADFEHLEFKSQISSRDLQISIGEGLLSMSLVLGSYFRNRGHFDRDIMARVMEEIFCSYCSALTLKSFEFQGCIDWQELADRMSEEMGCDRHVLAAEGDKSQEMLEGPHLGVVNGPFPVPELIRTIHIASLFAVLDLRS